MKIFKSYNHFIVFALLLSLFTLANGCKSKKTVTTGGTLVEKNKKQLVNDVLKKQVDYRTVSGKANFELIPLDSKKSQKVNAVIKVVKGKAIQISLRIPLLGGEAARITATPDSLILIDRLKKRYVIEGISKFGKSNTSFNYYGLEALLTNSLFLPGEESVSDANLKKYERDINGDVYLLKAKDQSSALYNFAIDASDRIVSTLIFSTKNDYTIQWSYKDFIKDGRNIYPTLMLGNVDLKGNRFDVKISYDKLDINKELDIDMSVPTSDRYSKVSLKDIFKGIAGGL